MKPIVNVLWTGGLDSTARIVELSRKPLTIQPYYIVDNHRVSTKKEVEAMKNIKETLLADKLTKAEIRPVISIMVSEITPDKAITNAWTALNKRYKVGSQYDFLARYAKQNNIILEVGIEKGDGRAQTAIHNESKMIKFHDESGINYRIEEESSSSDTNELFKYFTFPLWEKDKHAEVRMMEELGAADIVGMTWFCHSPLFGGPCGHCNPCKDARHYGFSWRLSTTRYLLWYILRPKSVARSLISNILKK